MQVIEGNFDKTEQSNKPMAKDVLNAVLGFFEELDENPDDAIVLTYDNETGEFGMYSNADIPNSLFLLLTAQRNCFGGQ